MAEKKRINLVVDTKKKQKWEKTVEESTDYGSLSQLIRQSVEAEIANAHSTAPDNNESAPSSGTDTEKLDEISDTLTRIQKQIVEVEDRVVTVEKEVTAESTANLKNEVYAALPLKSNENEPDGKTAGQIAEQIGADRDEVSNALNSLQTDTGTVDESTPIDDGQTAWVRKE